MRQDVGRCRRGVAGGNKPVAHAPLGEYSRQEVEEIKHTEKRGEPRRGPPLKKSLSMKKYL